MRWFPAGGGCHPGATGARAQTHERARTRIDLIRAVCLSLKKIDFSSFLWEASIVARSLTYRPGQLISLPFSPLPSPFAIFILQVADQLVQFRSLTDILCVKRTLGGAFSVFGRRRVFRGVPASRGGPPSDADLVTSLSPNAPPPLSSASSAASLTPTRTSLSSASASAASSSSRKFPGSDLVGADVSENEQRLWCHVQSSFNGDGGWMGKDDDGEGVPSPSEGFMGGGDGGRGVGGAVDGAFEAEKGTVEEESADAIDVSGFLGFSLYRINTGILKVKC